MKEAETRESHIAPRTPEAAVGREIEIAICRFAYIPLSLTYWQILRGNGRPGGLLPFHTAMPPLGADPSAPLAVKEYLIDVACGELRSLPTYSARRDKRHENGTGRPTSPPYMLSSAPIAIANTAISHKRRLSGSKVAKGERGRVERTYMLPVICAHI